MYQEMFKECVDTMKTRHIERNDAVVSVFKELIEDNERLRAVPEQLHKEMTERMIEERKIERKLAVRKMQERLKAQKFTHKNFGELVEVEVIDQVAKEMLEGKK